jgi:4-hydroxymandelate oxidase
MMETPSKDSGDAQKFLALHEFEPEARRLLPHAVYEYVAGGASDEYSIRANEKGYRKILLRPRVLRPVMPVALGQELFGKPLPVHPRVTPIISR